MTSSLFADYNVSRETMELLHAFVELTKKWTARINLIAPSTVNDIWSRHVIDSAQLMRHVSGPFNSWVDLGSGGGFPGIVVAILAKESHPAAQVTLVESDQRKAIFLRAVARELGLNILVEAQRIDKLAPQAADVVSARALMPMKALLPHLHRHLDPSGIAILHKGRRFAAEIDEVKPDWDFELTQYPSITDPEARILILKGITRA